MSDTLEQEQPERDAKWLTQEFPDLVTQWLTELHEKKLEVIEQAAAEALADGRFGVMVTMTPNPREGSYSIVAQVHPRVPFGAIHERWT